MKTVTFVAKGPSAANAKDWIEGDLATINDSGNLVPDVPIRYVFFTHKELLFDGIFQMKDRIQTYVSCPLRPTEFKPLPIWFDDVDHVETEHRWCKPDKLQERIDAGGICHYNTACGALHYLCKQGYEKIRVIGIDGGSSYAPGMKPVNTQLFLRTATIMERTDFFSEWKRVTIHLCKVLHQNYGTHFQWYKI